MSPDQPLLVTGIPRSGTTLAASIIDAMENSLSLCEPPWGYHDYWQSDTAIEYVLRIQNQVSNIYAAIRFGEPLREHRLADGQLQTNYYERDEAGVVRLTKRQEVVLEIDCPVDKLLLSIKHNAPFSSVLPQLLQLTPYHILAVVRHPVPVILSWISLEDYSDRHNGFPPARGYLPDGAKFWPDVTSRPVPTGRERLLSQVKLCQAFFRRYAECAGQPRFSVVRYEDLAGDPSVLYSHTGRRLQRGVDVSNQNNNRHYNMELVPHIADLIEQCGNHSARWYPDLLKFQ